LGQQKKGWAIKNRNEWTEERSDDQEGSEDPNQPMVRREEANLNKTPTLINRVPDTKKIINKEKGGIESLSQREKRDIKRLAIRGRNKTPSNTPKLAGTGETYRQKTPERKDYYFLANDEWKKQYNQREQINQQKVRVLFLDFGNDELKPRVDGSG